VAKLVAARCPRCGAGVKLDPTSDYVTCTYCETSSFIQRDKPPVTAHVPNPLVPVIHVPPERVTPVVIAAAVGALALVAGSLFAVAASEAGSKKAPPLPHSAPTAVEVPSDRPAVKLAPPITEAGEPIPDAEQLIAAMSAGFLACYDEARRAGQTSGGKFALHIRVASDSTETTVESSELSASLVDCMRGATQSFRFATQSGTTVMRVDGKLTPPFTRDGQPCACIPGDPLCSCF
jgi:DNA-directed RNA polymerase subunit RPC12/RpoP